MTAHLHVAAPRSARAGSSPQHPRIRVVLADDHPVVRRSLRALLDREEDLEVIAEALSLSTAMSRVRDHLPRVLVLDMRLPGGSSAEAIRALRVEAPGTEVVALTMEKSPLLARQAIDAGALGFVLKDRADSELLTAIRCAARGEEYVSTRVADGCEALLMQFALRGHLIGT